MARKLKTYQTSLGFFEQAIAAPSDEESTDPDVIAATIWFSWAR